jgi:hypothetical protein
MFVNYTFYNEKIILFPIKNFYPWIQTNGKKLKHRIGVVAPLSGKKGYLNKTQINPYFKKLLLRNTKPEKLE